MSIERKSAAIMFTDIAGYTKAMSENEQKALEMLRKKRSIIKPLIHDFNGTYVKEIEMGLYPILNQDFMHLHALKSYKRKYKKII